jgi:hypothetical protein
MGPAANWGPAPTSPQEVRDGLASGTSHFFVNAIGSNVVYQVDAETGAVDAFPLPMPGRMVSPTWTVSVHPGRGGRPTKVDLATGDVVSASVGCTLRRSGGENGRLFTILGLTRIAETSPRAASSAGCSAHRRRVLGLADGTELFAPTCRPDDLRRI